MPTINSPTPDATATTNGKVRLAGDLTGTAAAPTVAKVNGITITGTPSTGQVPTATSTTAATWQTPSGGGGSTSVAMGHPPGDALGHVGAPTQWFANLQTANTSKNITTLQAFCVTVSGSNTVRMGIYDASGTLLASGTTTVTTVGKFSVTIASTAIVLGNNYWLALINETNTPATNFAYFNSNANSTLVNQYSGGSTLPSTLTGGVTTATAFCIVAY